VRPDAAPETEVLDNLKRLEHAEDLYAIASALVREGHLREAKICCEAIIRLVPGSRCAQEADRLVSDSPAPPAAAAKVVQEHPELRRIAGERERISNGEEEEPGVAEQAAGLLKACRLAAEAGQRRHAEELARQAQALAPSRALADPVARGLLRSPDGPPDRVARWSCAYGEVEVGLECPGEGVRLACDLHCGPRVYHVLFDRGALTTWTTADTSALPAASGRGR
jgi:hypothetical protein